MSASDLVPRPMRLEEFEPLVGREFQADCSPAPVTLSLVEAVRVRGPNDYERPAFSLLFHTPPSKLLVAGIYAMRCGGFGPDLICINPVIPPYRSQAGHYYEALFN